jgi:hypothetical protein
MAGWRTQDRSRLDAHRADGARDGSSPDGVGSRRDGDGRGRVIETDTTIRLNRAPALTLWAAVVAEPVGFDRPTALTLGRAVAGLSAHAKGVALGIVEPRPELVRERGERLGEGERLHVDLLGRAVPVARTPGGLRAVNQGKPGDPGQVERYLAGKFKDRLKEARRAMAELAASMGPQELHRRGFRLYEAFRPAVPAGRREAAHA